MTATDDIKFMRRCIELASKAAGLTYPNPLVGSVIVHDGKIIGEGYHLKAGGPHAEVNAINSVRNKALLKSASIYVNLEPCSHFGKTPPCADFIIENSIPRVVVGALDSNEMVSGNGISRLRDAGCEVKTGVAEKECRSLNRRFFTFHEKKRPYIILKWAMSADGYIDVERKAGQPAGPNWITGKPERILVHRWRAMEQSILVGAGTARIDSPLLNVRDWTGPSPLRLYLSSSGSVGFQHSDSETPGSAVVFTHNADAEINNAVRVVLDPNTASSVQVAQYLYNTGIQSVLIEGGARVLNHFISTGLWDEARVFTGNKLFHGGLRAPEITGEYSETAVFSSSRLITYFRTSRRDIGDC
jgi:diaminohydroxyphosphoribosylaminopyrimidine deaminase/5-amino-6-(5-phosphoribosylamino)uracil reductase